MNGSPGSAEFLSSTDDRGSAVAEYVAVVGLLALLFGAVVQVGVVQHVRATAVDSAGEGARFGALAGNEPADGAARTADLLGVALSPAYAQDVSAGVVLVGGVEVVEVTVRAPLPVAGLVGPDRALVVTGHARVEQP